MSCCAVQHSGITRVYFNDELSLGEILRLAQESEVEHVDK